MSNICRECGSEKRYDEYHRFFKPCDSCNTKQALRYDNNNENKTLEKKKNYYHNNKEFFSEQNKKRKCKITDPENQIYTLTEKINLLYQLLIPFSFITQLKLYSY